MIRYTMLPKNEIKSLRREYRIRLLVVALFVISCSVIIGILVLIPSYVISYIQENEALTKLENIEKSQKASGADDIKQSLALIQNTAKSILNDARDVPYSGLVATVLSHRTPDILIDSFDLTAEIGSGTPVVIIIQGKAATREALVSYKGSLENDAAFSSVELPVSDLAKSRDLSFSMRITTKLMSNIK